MKLKTINISTSGKLIISGEHSVLNKYPCISMCVDKKIHITISQRLDKIINIKSTNFGNEQFTLNTNKPIKEWCQSIYFLCNKLSSIGLDITIKSKIKNGYGSSGAVFSCVSCGLLLIQNELLSKQELIQKTLQLYYNFYRKNKIFKPSGIDIVTTILGGVVFFDIKKKIIKNINYNFLQKFNIYSIYTGHKTQTANTVKIAKKVKNYKNICKKIGKITNKLLNCFLTTNNIDEFNKLIYINQQLLEKLNLIDQDEKNILDQCKKQNITAKISGSGLGDYILAFQNKNNQNNFNINNYSINKLKINKNGIQFKIKTSFFAPINIALIKYWGKRNDLLNLPTSSSISISSNNLGTETFIENSLNNNIIFNKKKIDKNSDIYNRTFNFVNYFIKNFTNEKNVKIKIITKNNIPTASGLASSASAFASLTMALNNFFNLNYDEKKLSQIARIGSGSASRSVFENSKFVKWNKGKKNNGEDCYAEKIILNKNDFKNKIDVLILKLSNAQKKISSRDAMKITIEKSKTYKKWLEQTENNFNNFEKIKNFKTLGNIIEENSILMHKCINEAGIKYFNQKTIKIINFVKNLRQNKLYVYTTIDAGANVVLIFNKKDKIKIINKLIKNHIVKKNQILEF